MRCLGHWESAELEGTFPRGRSEPNYFLASDGQTVAKVKSATKKKKSASAAKKRAPSKKSAKKPTKKTKKAPTKSRTGSKSQPQPRTKPQARRAHTGTPRTLADCRREIDGIDKDIIALLDRRAEVARRVGEVKAEKGAEFFDAGRHIQLLNGISKRGTGSFPPQGLRDVFCEVLSVCLNLQAPQTIAFLGPEATFTHIAARRAFGRAPRFVPYETIADVFHAVEKLWAQYGLVPVENSTGGVIHATLDEMMNSDLSICAEIHIPIRHNLLNDGPIDQIDRICTHPQILSQCRMWLRENLPGIKLEEVASSAEGARLAQANRTTATIGSNMASEIYGLEILEAGIEDQKDNVTRFLVIGNQSPRPSSNDRTSLMFSIKDVPGALYHLLKPFAQRKINMTKIESRPTRKRAWDYIFFVDIEGHISRPAVRKVVDDLEKHCNFLRVLGSYPVDLHGDLTRV